MQYWGFAWMLYAGGLLCLLLNIDTNSVYLLELRKILDMLNILLFMFGIFAFIHVQIPAYWYRFSFYMILLVGVCLLYGFDLLSFYLPISIFQTAITLVICHHIYKYWNLSHVAKALAISCFLLWGVGKSILSLMEFYYYPMSNLYLAEVGFSQVLNICTVGIYIQYTRKGIGLTERLYQTVVENVSDAIFYYRLAPYHAFEYVTPSVETVTGYPSKRFYQDPRIYMKLVKSQYLDEIEDTFNGRIRHDSGQILEFIRRDGSSFWGEINSSIILDGHDEPIAVEGSLRDITAMKSAELAQITAKQSRDLLLSYISHELRTPVTSIAGYLDAINDGVIHKNADIQEAMETITSRTMILKKLIDDLDQLSQLETNQFSFQFMTHTVSDLVENLLQRHFPGFDTLTTSQFCCDKNHMDTCLVVADEDRIGQVFSNLLDNANKYADGNSPPSPKVRLWIDTQKEGFFVCVTNTGKGIPEKDLPFIFNRFYRGSDPEERKTQRGRGLGLAISSEIIEAHNGEIYAESQNGVTTFTFSLPLFKQPDK